MLMQSKLRFSALDGYVLIDANNVSVMNDIEPAVQISLNEWETFRKELRLEDTVNYSNGETPMTVLQFRAYVEIFRELRNLEAEKEGLLG